MLCFIGKAQEVEPTGAPTDAALNTTRLGWSVSDRVPCDELLESPIPPKWASTIDTHCGTPRSNEHTPLRGYETRLITGRTLVVVLALVLRNPIGYHPYGLAIVLRCKSGGRFKVGVVILCFCMTQRSVPYLTRSLTVACLCHACATSTALQVAIRKMILMSCDKNNSRTENSNVVIIILFL